MCVGLRVCADCDVDDGFAYVCRNVGNNRCGLRSRTFNTRTKCYRGLHHTRAESAARSVCGGLKLAKDHCVDDLADWCDVDNQCGQALHERRHSVTFVRVAALNVGVQTMTCASDQVKADKGFMLTMVRVGQAGQGWALEYAPDALKGDEDFATKAVERADAGRVVDVLELVVGHHDLAVRQKLWVTALKAHPQTIAASDSLPDDLLNSVEFWSEIPINALGHLPAPIKRDTWRLFTLLESKWNEWCQIEFGADCGSSLASSHGSYYPGDPNDPARASPKWEELLKIATSAALARRDVKRLHTLKLGDWYALCEPTCKNRQPRRAFMLLAVRVDARILKCVDMYDISGSGLLHDRKFMLDAVKENIDALNYAGEFKQQASFWVDVMAHHGLDLLINTREFKRLASFWVGVVAQHGLELLKEAPRGLLNDPEKMGFLMHELGDGVLQYATPRVRAKLEKLARPKTAPNPSGHGTRSFGHDATESKMSTPSTRRRAPDTNLVGHGTVPVKHMASASAQPVEDTPSVMPKKAKKKNLIHWFQKKVLKNR